MRASSIHAPAAVACTWEVRVSAPVEWVWEELATLDVILAATPSALVTEVALGGRMASLTLRRGWGPLSRVTQGHATLQPVHLRHHLLVGLHLPDLGLDYHGRIDLLPAGADQTRLRYQAHLRCPHRGARRSPMVLRSLVEDHVRAVIGTAQRRAERHHLARISLGGSGADRVSTGRRRRRPSRAHVSSTTALDRPADAAR